MSGSRTDADVLVDMGLLLIDALSAMAGGRHNYNFLSVQRKRDGEDVIRDMAPKTEYDPHRKADSHQNRSKAEDFVDLLGALALETL